MQPQSRMLSGTLSNALCSLKDQLRIWNSQNQESFHLLEFMSS